MIITLTLYYLYNIISNINIILVVIMGMLIFSGLTFVVEKDANPGKQRFKKF